MTDTVTSEEETYVRSRQEIEGLIDHLSDGTVTSIRPDTLAEIVRFLEWTIGKEVKPKWI